jgi:hypothetical protein
MQIHTVLHKVLARVSTQTDQPPRSDAWPYGRTVNSLEKTLDVYYNLG